MSGRKAGSPVTPRNHDQTPVDFSIPTVQSVLDRATDFVFIVDRHFRFLAANKMFADLFGEAGEPVVGRRCTQIVHGTGDPPPSCPHLRAIREGQTVVEHTYGSHYGIHLRVSVIPILSASRDPVATIHIGRVIFENEQRNGEESLETALRDVSSTSPTVRLTPRQQQVFRLLMEGKSAKEIGYSLSISARTAEFHKRQLMQNLGVKSVAGLIKLAFVEKLPL